jgi:hypothetical protein
MMWLGWIAAAGAGATGGGRRSIAGAGAAEASGR